MAERKIHPWRLGEIMVQKGWITWDQLEIALQLQKEAEKKEKFTQLMVGIPAKSDKIAPVLNLGEVLIRHGWISWDQLSEALALQKATGKILGKILLDNGYVSGKDLQRALAIQYNMSFVDFDKIKIPPEVVQIIPKQMAYNLQVFPLVKKGPTLLVAIADPNNVDSQIALEKALPDCDILTALATKEDLDKALLTYYGPD